MDVGVDGGGDFLETCWLVSNHFFDGYYSIFQSMEHMAYDYI